MHEHPDAARDGITHATACVARRATFAAAAWLLLLGLLADGSAAALPAHTARAPGSASAPVHLIVLYTNDVHGHLFPFDYGTLHSVGGVARRATLLQRLGAGRPEVLVLDAGDLWERGPLSKRYHGKPEVLAMNVAGYNLMTLGNNEFRAGIPNLLQRQREAHFPMLSANVRLRSTGRPIAREYVILNRAGLRIGIFGLTAPRIVTYPGLADLQVEDPITSAKRMARFLRPQVDLLLALTHLGFPLDRVLAEEVPAIDAIIGGDSHTRLDHPYVVHSEAAPDKAIPIVQDGEYGVRQGRLDLWVQPGHRPSSVVRFSGELILVTSRLPESPKVNRVLKPYFAEAGTAHPDLVPAGPD